MGSDVWLVFEWWATLFLFGAFAFPITKRLFAGWYDDGYLFTKAVGIALVTFIVYLVGSLGLLPFTKSTIFFSLGVIFVLGLLVRDRKGERFDRKRVFLILFEELFFLAALAFWSWIKGHQPDIHDLEKFMDFGFMNSVLHSRFFPAPDMWYAGSSINYYYFGHIALAVLTKFSGIDLAYTFNLMLASIFAFTLTMSFSIGVRVIGEVREIGVKTKVLAGALTAFLVTLAGNLQTIYAFTPGYSGDPPGGPPPFWKLGFSLSGLANYWYANATRFIPFSIHEFPSYSFVVSDVHGHVLSLPFVLLAIALLVHIFSARDSKSLAFFPLIFYGFLVGVLLMTNALDGPIYFALLTALLIWSDKGDWRDKGKAIAVVVVTAAITSLPFFLHFKPFVSGVAVNCPPAFLANMKIGPLLFEGVEKCQRSPAWMLLLLWGLFLYCGGWLLGRLGGLGRLGTKRTQIEKLLLVFFVFSIGLIVFPEFLYFKDIYPMHFRSNTMFKLGYQAFILFGIVSGYAIMTIRKKVFYLFLLPLLFLVSIFPLFSVRSYFRGLTEYEGLYGLTWFAQEYPDDYKAIEWLKGQLEGSPAKHGAITTGLPVVIEADGDSYTDYARVSTLTGAPTVIGWAVHEWLWRGTYDVVSPRREDVLQIYESRDLAYTRDLLAKYHVRYVFVGTLERRKYTKLKEDKFSQLGKEVFRSGQTVVYLITS